MTQTQNVLFVIGRIVFALYWLQTAYSHFKNSSSLTDYASSKSVIAPRAAVVGTGLLALIGAISIGFGFYPTVGIIALFIFLVGVTFMMHNFWTATDPSMRMVEMINFTKNLALAASLLMLLAIPQPWFWSI